MRKLLKPFVAVFAFLDSIIESVVRPAQFRRRVQDRAHMIEGSSPDPNRRPPRR